MVALPEDELLVPDGELLVDDEVDEDVLLGVLDVDVLDDVVDEVLDEVELEVDVGLQS